MAFDRERIKKKAAALGAKGVYVGTSSWKYEGWLDRNKHPDGVRGPSVATGHGVAGSS